MALFSTTTTILLISKYKILLSIWPKEGKWAAARATICGRPWCQQIDPPCLLITLSVSYWKLWHFDSMNQIYFPSRESQLNHYLTFPFVSKLSYPHSLRMERPRLCSVCLSAFRKALCLCACICVNLHWSISLCVLSVYGSYGCVRACYLRHPHKPDKSHSVKAMN